jgi:hypothetical protein
LSVAGYAGASVTVPVKLFRNNGNGTFTDVAASIGMSDPVISWGVTWADFDNNGFEDCFVAVSGQSTSCLIYRNNGDGTFTNVTNAAGLGSLVQLSAAWADYDHDGDMDLYTSGSASNGNHLFRNNGDSTKRWLEIALVGTQSNASGIGAQIVVNAGPLRMLREVATGVGYRSQNSMTVHFGLDTCHTADSIIVRWPRGMVSTLEGVAANQTITIVEGTTSAREPVPLPSKTMMLQNYPNPFNPSTRIRYVVAERQHVVLSVVDQLGRLVDVLVDNNLNPGTYEAVLDGSRMASGIYYCRLCAGHTVETGKVVLLR